MSSINIRDIRDLDTFTEYLAWYLTSEQRTNRHLAERAQNTAGELSKVARRALANADRRPAPYEDGLVVSPGHPAADELKRHSCLFSMDSMNGVVTAHGKTVRMIVLGDRP